MAFVLALLLTGQCAVTMVAFITDDFVVVRDVYGLPRGCATGSFSVNQERRIVQVRWGDAAFKRTANIFLPLWPVVGKFQIHYTWGEDTATVGNIRTPVIYTERRNNIAES